METKTKTKKKKKNATKKKIPRTWKIEESKLDTDSEATESGRL